MMDTQNPIRDAMEHASTIPDDGAVYGMDDYDLLPADDYDDGSFDPKTPINWEVVKRCAVLDQNDRDNARRLLQWFGDDLVYVSRMGWLTWRETHWQRDEGELNARYMAQNVVDKIKLEPFMLKLDRAKQDIVDAARQLKKKPEDKHSIGERQVIDRADKMLKALYSERSKRKSFAVSSGNSTKTGAMLQQAQSLKVIDQNALDADRMQFNVRNGTLVFYKEKGESWTRENPIYVSRFEFKPHERRDMLTKVADVDFDPNATCPFFEKDFLGVVQPESDMQLFLQVFQGYSLMIGGNDEQKLAFHYGTGANGKSAFVELFGALAGSYRTVVSPETMTGEGQRQGQQASPDIARLFNTRFVTVEELPKNAPLKEDLIKAVSGGTKMTARFLMQNIFEFEPMFTATLTGNTKPSISGSDYGIWRRVLLVEWGVTIPEEKRIPPSELNARLTSERSGILNWLIDGILLYLENGLNRYIPQKVTEFTQDYRSERDNISVFVEECLVREEGSKVQAGPMHKAYCDWCERNGLTAAKQRTFGDRLSELGYEKERGRIYIYLNVRLDYQPVEDHQADYGAR